MRGQDCEVYRPYDALTNEFRGTQAKIICSDRVVREIRKQEDRRNRRRGNHTGSMAADLFCPDKVESQNQKESASGIQKCVDVGKNGERVHLFPKPQKNKKNDPKSTHEMPIPSNRAG